MEEFPRKSVSLFNSDSGRQMQAYIGPYVKLFLLKMECDLYKKVSRFTSTWKCFCHYWRMDTKKVNNSYCWYKIKTVTSNSFCIKGSPAVHSTLPRTVQPVAFYFVHFTLIFFLS
jgi:hypothetical protein